MPFADYKDFDECVSKNKDKNDPQAYCGTIKHKVEGGAPLAEAFKEAEAVDKQIGLEKLRARRLKGPHSSWGVPFKMEKLQEMTRITGDAIHPVKTDNKILYRMQELLRGARTLTRSPIILNHIESPEDAQQFLKKWGNHPALHPTVKKVIQAMALGKRGIDGGHVDFADWNDAANAVKYAASVHDDDFEGLLHSGLVHSVSIGARPLLGFEDESRLIPAGLVFEDLSLLTAPLRPADPQASIKVIEAWLPHEDEEKLVENVTEDTTSVGLPPGVRKKAADGALILGPEEEAETGQKGEGVKAAPTATAGTQEVWKAQASRLSTMGQNLASLEKVGEIGSEKMEKTTEQQRTTGQNTGIEANSTASDNRNTAQTSATETARANPQAQDAHPTNESRQALSSPSGGAGVQTGQMGDSKQGSDISAETGQMQNKEPFMLYASQLNDNLEKLVNVLGMFDKRLKAVENGRGLPVAQGRLGPDVKVTAQSGVGPEQTMENIFGSKDNSDAVAVKKGTSTTSLGKMLEEQSGKKPKYGTGF